jgi:hypothetical protein
VKEGGPIPCRFAAAVEKRLRMYALEHDITLSDAIRVMVNRGFATLEAPAPAADSPPPRRRVLSRGVIG